MTLDSGKPQWKHDCTNCRFLGLTIGGGHLADLYVCEGSDPGDRDPTILARFSDEGSDYLSCPLEGAHPGGHSELWAAASIYRGVKP